MGPDISITITASQVAWYGAIVGTLGLGLQALNAYRDRRRHLVSRSLTQDTSWLASCGAVLVLGLAFG